MKRNGYGYSIADERHSADGTDQLPDMSLEPDGPAHGWLGGLVELACALALAAILVLFVFIGLGVLPDVPV